MLSPIEVMFTVPSSSAMYYVLAFTASGSLRAFIIGIVENAVVGKSHKRLSFEIFPPQRDTEFITYRTKIT